jgi:hypothetical protein
MRRTLLRARLRPARRLYEKQMARIHKAHEKYRLEKVAKEEKEAQDGKGSKESG